MSNFQQKPGTGALFRSDKEGNESRPDYKGDLTLENGDKIRIAGWLKDGAKGKFLSLKVDKPRDDREAVKSDGRASSGGVSGGGGGGGYPQSGRGNNRPSGGYDLDDSDIPFVRMAGEYDV